MFLLSRGGGGGISKEGREGHWHGRAIGMGEGGTPNSRGHATKRGLRVPNPNSRGHATKRGLRVPNPNSRGHTTKRGLRVPNHNSRGHTTKRGLRVPNPHSRGHTTKRGLRVPNPNSRGHATKRGLRVPNLTKQQKEIWFLRDHPAKRDKFRSGYLTPTFLGAQKRAEVLRQPCILGGPQRQAQGKNQKWPTGGHIAYKHAFSVKLVIVSLRLGHVFFLFLR